MKQNLKKILVMAVLFLILFLYVSCSNLTKEEPGPSGQLVSPEKIMLCYKPFQKSLLT